jgi:hypothetical protein
MVLVLLLRGSFSASDRLYQSRLSPLIVQLMTFDVSHPFVHAHHLAVGKIASGTPDP